MKLMILKIKTLNYKIRLISLKTYLIDQLNLLRIKCLAKKKNVKIIGIFQKIYILHNIFSDKTIESIQDDYIWNKENDKDKDKGKDDYEIGM